LIVLDVLNTETSRAYYRSALETLSMRCTM